MDYRLLSKDLFPDYKPPSRPSQEDKYIQQLFNAENISVRLTPEKAKKIMFHYLNKKNDLELYNIGEKIVHKPSTRTLWLFASTNIRELLQKIQPRVEQYANTEVFNYKKEALTLYPGRIGEFKQTARYCLYCYLAILHYTLSEDYSIEVQLTKELGDAADIITTSYPAVIKHDCSEVVITVRGKNIISRTLKSTNPVLEDLLKPNKRLAILPDNDDIISMAKILINENMNNQNFDLAELAHLLCVSKRTIQRKLQSAGTTFLQLKNAERTKFITNQLTNGDTKEALNFMAKLKKDNQKAL